MQKKFLLEKRFYYCTIEIQKQANLGADNLQKKFLILFGVLILFQVADIFFVEDLPLELEMLRGDKKFPAFKTNFLDGEVATEKIFSGKITALVLWTTNNELSFDLLKNLDAEIKNLPSNVQVIGLVGDNNFSDAKSIAKKFSPHIRHLEVNDDFFPVLSKIRTAPTTIFIDERGNLVGQPAGADLKFILRELNFVLEKDSPRSQALKKIHHIILNRQ